MLVLPGHRTNDTSTLHQFKLSNGNKEAYFADIMRLSYTAILFMQ